jgi:NAD(P)-dependent dehydrogenase (short-subunit alcohol dehydrogenase family)
MLTVNALRDRLLDGRAIALAGGPPEPMRRAFERLGARVEAVPAELAGGEEERVGEWARGVGPLDAVVYDARPAFGAGGPQALGEALERGWVAVREVANGALIPGERPSKVVLLAPRPQAGSHAEAARSGLENLARTLSIEWARFGVTAAMIAPGPATTDEQLSELVCFLVSRAGEYLSGCRLELGAVS